MSVPRAYCIINCYSLAGGQTASMAHGRVVLEADLLLPRLVGSFRLDTPFDLLALTLAIVRSPHRQHHHRCQSNAHRLAVSAPSHTEIDTDSVVHSPSSAAGIPSNPTSQCTAPRGPPPPPQGGPTATLTTRPGASSPTTKTLSPRSLRAQTSLAASNLPRAPPLTRPPTSRLRPPLTTTTELRNHHMRPANRTELERRLRAQQHRSH